MTLAKLIKRLAATTQIRPYMEKEVDVITAHREDDITIILVWDDEEVEA